MISTEPKPEHFSLENNYPVTMMEQEEEEGKKRAENAMRVENNCSSTWLAGPGAGGSRISGTGPGGEYPAAREQWAACRKNQRDCGRKTTDIAECRLACIGEEVLGADMGKKG